MGLLKTTKCLRSPLTAQGCQFASETDTEVVAHLITLAIEEGGHDLLAAVQQVLPKLQGRLRARCH